MSQQKSKDAGFCSLRILPVFEYNICDLFERKDNVPNKPKVRCRDCKHFNSEKQSSDKSV